jgi:hypothetical protein
MGGVSHSIQWWWDYFRQLFNIQAFSVEGSITLGPGEQTIEITTKYPNPDAVFLSAEEPEDEIATCVGDVNWVACRVLENGFVLFADIKSNSCVVNYTVRYGTDRNDPNTPIKDKDQKKDK